MLRDWLERAFRDNRRWDDVARDLIASEGESGFDGPVNFILEIARNRWSASPECFSEYDSTAPAATIIRSLGGLRMISLT